MLKAVKFSMVAGHAPLAEKSKLLKEVGFDGVDMTEHVDAAEVGWVRDHYVPLMVEFATALRDSIKESVTRHAAAQLIQCKVLEHERNLRMVLEAPASQGSASELASVAPDSPDSSRVLNRSVKS